MPLIHPGFPSASAYLVMAPMVLGSVLYRMPAMRPAAMMTAVTAQTIFLTRGFALREYAQIGKMSGIMVMWNMYLNWLKNLSAALSLRNAPRARQRESYSSPMHITATIREMIFFLALYCLNIFTTAYTSKIVSSQSTGAMLAIRICLIYLTSV